LSGTGANKVEAGPATGLVAGIMKDLLFDNTMQSDPIATYDYMEVYMKGDIRYKVRAQSRMRRHSRRASAPRRSTRVACRRCAPARRCSTRK